MKRIGKGLTILGAVLVVAAGAGWHLATSPQLRFDDSGGVRVVGCDGADPAGACVQLFCKQSVLSDPRVGARARIEFTHTSEEPNGDLWQIGLVHRPADTRYQREVRFACRMQQTRVLQTVLTDGP